MSFDYQFKVIVIGDSSVGKTTIVNRFVTDKYTENPNTIGIETKSVSLSILSSKVKLNIWDTAGSEHFRSLTRSYFRACAAAIIVYDITNPTSFKNAQFWINDCLENANKNTQLLLVGSKNDLDSYRKISKEEGRLLAKKMSIDYIECSSKSGENIKEIFSKICGQIITKIEENKIVIDSLDQGIRLGSNKLKYLKKSETENNEGNCC